MSAGDKNQLLEQNNAWCELGDPKELCKIQSVLDILLDGFEYFLFSSLFGEDSHFD